MTRLSFINKEQKGFSLIEILLAMALLGGLGLMSAKIIEMIQQNSKNLKRKENHLQYHVNALRVLQNYLKGIKRHQFDNELFFRISANKTLSRHSTSLNGASLTNYTGAPTMLTSHVFHKKMSDRTLNYISVCLPLAQANKLDSISYGSLTINALWPFIRSSTKGFEVHCCQRSNPMCVNPVIKKDSQLFVQVFRQDPKKGSLTPLIKKNEFGSLSSAGFFIFSNQTNDKILHVRFFTFFNECFSQRIMFGKNSSKCNHQLDLKTVEFIEEFNYAAESINTLGGEIGF
jgi:prepilin-type N-terminal cleavage/methylation domain-containing protein